MALGLASGAFDRRLDPKGSSPIAVAVSGGADSLCALMLTAAWAARHGRRVLALSVDHGLNPDSAAWTRSVARAAEDLGADFQALAWCGAKPATGIPAAARQARHALLADAARAAGAGVIVTGHSLDDAFENALMGLGGLDEWAPSPVWPQGRGLFLLRPLLSHRRAPIRHALAKAGLSWIDDPANANPEHPRVRARGRLEQEDPPIIVEPAQAADLAASCRFEGEAIMIGRRDLAASAPQSRALMIAAAAVCTGGGTRPPRAHRLARLVSALAGNEMFTASLAGARIAAGDTVVFTREAGRGGLPSARLAAGEIGVWDGRYEIKSGAEVSEVRPLGGLASRLPSAQRKALAAFPAAVRPSLPAILRQDGTATCPILAGDGGVGARPLVWGRFLAACRVVRDEWSAYGMMRMAKPPSNPYLGGEGRKGEIHELA